MAALLEEAVSYTHLDVYKRQVDSRIADLMRRNNPTVGLAAHLGQVDVRITARATTEERAAEMLDDVATDVRARLGDFVYAEGDVALEAVVVAALQAAGYSLALVETNTGGELATRLQAAPGADQIIRRAQVVSSPAEIGSSGPANLVSSGAAEWAVRQLLSDAQEDGATLGFALCGTMDPAAGPYGVYRGETFVAIATADGAHSMRIDTGGTDELARRWVGNGALNWLRLWLAGRAN